MPKRVVINMPTALQTTASERASLKKAFKSKLIGVLKHHSRSPGHDITNIGDVRVDIIGIGSVPGRAKRKVAKKAAKKR